MRDKKQKQKDEASTVEFGMEFGDVNASKFYETAEANKHVAKKQTKR